MLAYLGTATICLTLFFSLSQFFFSRKSSQIKLVNFSVNAQLLFSLFAFIFLIYAYIVSDFSVKNVFQNSHSTKPLIYKISAVWGNHEGSMLLWILVLTLFNYFIFKFYNSKNSKLILKTLEIQSLIIFGFVLFSLLTSNPFEKILPVPENGLGFNPILQDPALAIHPPLLYIGYVGFSAAFSISVATLSLDKNFEVDWFKYMKPFVVIAWTFLTIGIAFGSLWAYYELGWGGWWFWDPVENASFMPWLLGTALLHSLIIVEKRKSLQSWVLLLSILTFLLSVIGTFLVRSGILTSVHTFALDPTRGIYILTLVTLLTVYSLILFSLNSKKFLNESYFVFFSREGSILLNNVIMLIVCATVFLGTIYPLIIEALTNDKISVGEPYFNSTVIPIMIPALLVMGIGPILSWGKTNKLGMLKKIFPVMVAALVLTIIFLYIFKSYKPAGILGLFLAFWIIFNNILPLIKLPEKKLISMHLAHIGIGLIILGITGSSVWQEEKILKMKFNDEIIVKKHTIILEKISEIKAINYVALRGNFLVFDGNKKLVTKLEPENRFYPVTNNFTTEASIHVNLFRDLYIVLGEGNLDDGWTVRIYFNPLVIWIWIGALIVFIGGITLTAINIKKIKN